MKDSSDGWLDLDPGPKASGEIEAAPVDCMMIIWYGRMGVLASPQPSKGTRDIAECVAELTEKNSGAGFTGGWGSRGEKIRLLRPRRRRRGLRLRRRRPRRQRHGRGGRGG